MRVLLAILVGTCAVVAGCAGPTSKAVPTSRDIPTDLPEETGTLQGRVTDDAQVPLKGAVVSLPSLNRETNTAALGQFSFTDLLPGTYVVEVNAAGFQSALKEIEIRSQEIHELHFELVALAVLEPYHTTAIKNGRIFCGLDWRISADAPQGPLAACGALYTTPASDLDSFAVVFDLSSDNVSAVRELVFETEWTPTQTLGSGLRVFWEAYQEITATYGFTEDVRTFVHVEGRSPLRGSADHVDILDNVTGRTPAPQYCAPDGPCRFWARVFPHTNTLGSEAPADLSVYADQAYTHYVTEFYGAPAPPEFSARSP